MAGTMAIFLLPFIVFGQGVVLPWLDNMDSYIVWNKLAATYTPGFFSNNSSIPPFMGGQPKFAVAGGFSIFLFLNQILPSFAAVVVDYFMIHITAMLGMYRLVVRFISKGNQWVAASSAVAFSLQGFLPAWGLGIAGMPLVATIYLHTRTQPFKWWYVFLITYYAMGTNVQSVGIFVLLVWFAAAFAETIILKNRVLPQVLWGTFLLAVLLLLRIDLFEQIFSGKQFISHRTEFQHSLPADYSFSYNLNIFWQALKNPLGVLLNSGVFPLVMIAGLFAAVVSLRKRHSEKYIPIIAAASILLIAVFVSLLQTTIAVGIRNQYSFLRMYSFERVMVLIDFFWYVLFAYALHFFLQLNMKPVFIAGITLLQASLHCYHVSWWRAVFGLTDKYMPMSYKDYYSEDLFKKIGNSLGMPQSKYRVAGFGIQPAVLQHNGFFTVDGYCSNYPLSYKQHFSKVIAPELDSINMVQPYTQNSFDNWGHKLYLQTKETYLLAQTAPPVTKVNPKIIDYPKWNIHELKKIGCSYILSTVQIKRPEICGLKFAGEFENNTYHIYVFGLVQ